MNTKQLGLHFSAKTKTNTHISVGSPVLRMTVTNNRTPSPQLKHQQRLSIFLEHNSLKHYTYFSGPLTLDIYNKNKTKKKNWGDYKTSSIAKRLFEYLDDQ